MFKSSRLLIQNVRDFDGFMDQINIDYLVRNAMLEIDQDPWIGTKLHDMLTQQQFNVIEQNEKYLDYSKQQIQNVKL